MLAGSNFNILNIKNYFQKTQSLKLPSRFLFFSEKQKPRNDHFRLEYEVKDEMSKLWFSSYDKKWIVPPRYVVKILKVFFLV
jgi:hypothetical protein